MIVSIIGARPQFVKAAVVSRALKEAGIEEKIVHTGQHYDERMSDVFWRQLEIPPCDLNLQAGSGTHARQTALIMTGLEDYLTTQGKTVKGVLLYGDTNSTIAGALVAAKLHIPVIHVEAGLRSFNREMPEEVNRVVTDHLSQILFCPSQAAVEQLRKEGITRQVHDVGDVMYDAVRIFSEKAVTPSLDGSGTFLPEKYLLLTVHRPSNTDKPAHLSAILEGIGATGIQCVWPVHPRTRKSIEQANVAVPSSIILTVPFSYFEMLAALKGCFKVVTDSGGLQKEAYWMRKPCITLRTETEWTETLHHNWNILTGPERKKITAATAYEVDAATWTELYGDGGAAGKIAAVLRHELYDRHT